MSEQEPTGVTLEPGDRGGGAPRLPNGGHVSTFLSALSGNGWRVEQCQGRVLRASRSRPILRYRVRYVDQGRELSVEKIVIGKAYYRGDGAGTFDFMRELWDNGFADDPALTIPEPMAYVPELRLLLQAQAVGRALYAYIDDPDAALVPVAATGRWLAKLHATEVRSAAPLTRDFEATKLSLYLGELAGALPEWAGRLAELTAAVVAALARAADGPLVPTHGDYQPKNIYVSTGRVTVIDWDRFALAHPGRDVGHFLGQCMTMSYVRTGSFDRIRPWNEAFLDSYTDDAAVGVDALLPAYLARTFLEILYYKLVVRPVKDPSFVPAWLDECERWVAG